MRLRGLVSWLRTPLGLLAVVCVLHSLSSLLLVGLHHPFGFDETVYLSQINGDTPASAFSAPRARGLTFVVAPITVWTSNVAAVRLWLAAVTGAGMFAAFRPWIRLTRGYAVPLAALMFSSVWTTIYYGYEAMPNIYVALLAVAAVGAVFRHRRDRQARWIVTAGLCLAGLALIRPSDGVCVLVVLAGAVAVTAGFNRRSRAWLITAVVAGFAAGAVEWVVEAYVRFGDPMHRLDIAQAEQGPGGLHFSLGAQARALDGPLLCRQGCPVTAPGWTMAWWAVGAVLVAAGLWAARRRPAPMLVASAVGLAIALEYLVTVDYGAPRFLTPTYALLALPAAAGMIGLVRRAPGRTALVAAGAAALLLLAQIVSQVHIMRSSVMPKSDVKLEQYAALAAALRGQVPLRRPCLIAGVPSSPVAFLLKCASFPANPARFRLVAPRAEGSVLWLTPRRDLPAELAGWRVTRLRGIPAAPRGWYAATPGHGVPEPRDSSATAQVLDGPSPSWSAARHDGCAHPSYSSASSPRCMQRPRCC